MRLKLEDKLLRVLGPGDYHDTLVPRLTLRVRANARRWAVRYRLPKEPPRRLVLGDLAVLTLAQAREAARRELALVDRGEDPLEKRRAARDAERRRLAGESTARAIATWLRDRKLGPAARWKGGLEGGSARSFLPHVRRFKRDLGQKRLADLTPRDVERFVTAPEAAATRNRALTALRVFFRWCVRKGLLEADPSAGLGKERETERARTLTNEELRALIHGFDGTRYGRGVRMLALTGLRRDEVLGARWAWLDAEAGILTIPPEAEKTGRSRGEPRRVALSPQAVALLAEQRAALFSEGIRSDFIFATSTGERPHGDALKPTLYQLKGRRSNGRPASKHKLAKARPVLVAEDITLHDIRRTVADALLNRVGAAPWLVDHVVLGHARPKLIRTYMPVLPLDEARAALTKWADELARVLGAQEARA